MVSLLNGLGGLGEGLGAFAGKALQDQVGEADRTARVPLLNATPSAPDEPVESTPKDAAAPASTRVAGVPAEYLPFFQSAAKRTGIPVDVLIAQAKQESGFRPDIIGNAGEIGLMQIKPSTATSPGYGLAGIDPAKLKDPQTNIDFGASYLRARAGQTADLLNNPAEVDRALAAYNGGGDPAYTQNVRRHMGAT